MSGGQLEAFWAGTSYPLAYGAAPEQGYRLRLWEHRGGRSLVAPVPTLGSGGGYSGTNFSLPGWQRPYSTQTKPRVADIALPKPQPAHYRNRPGRCGVFLNLIRQPG
ncbi:hypothetical protein GGTG_08775 [Gaeumannomyces tritici R3-111a-1]|uniref:Uncharacterized protein n=1 Tax=Gaeumannomyces tritici (strain R3-111a-1) TaxID=644352 RepID=J3P5I6_GAET3|nr:hypothetical protein GGTG_08775 [Gaeumannomyces tritici R3-111a-1]EJT74937.1 hypothetical protein GGTG_08775 [Gaeumannomyces tritici R3-111a-1]